MDMRVYIQNELDRWNLGGLVYVKGPEWEWEDSRQVYGSYWLRIKYRADPNQDHLDDEMIKVKLGGWAKGGYWNRRHIRVAIEREGKNKLNDIIIKKVWSSSQKALTTGKNDSGAFEL